VGILFSIGEEEIPGGLVVSEVARGKYQGLGRGHEFFIGR
jgi:hypothetical protein